MNATHNDGKALERAVHLIQKTLLETDPLLKGGKFTIEINKRITVDRVRHEVDVYVVTQPGTSQESIVLFECKDWKQAVSKNEIMNFKEKVDLLGATRGVLVARRLTKDAKALLAQYKKVHFRRFDDDLKGIILGAEVIHTTHDSFSIQLGVMALDRTQPLPKNPKDCLCNWNDRTATLQVFGHELAHQIANEDKVVQQRKYDVESNHWYETQKRLEFLRGEFRLEGIEIAALDIRVKFFVKVGCGVPCYRCSIDGDGQLVSFDLVTDHFPSGKMQLDVVMAGIQKDTRKE